MQSPPALLPTSARKENPISAAWRQQRWLRTGALQEAIFKSANFCKIVTDDQGLIQIFNVGAERMLGYAASTVLRRLTVADLTDPAELGRRAAQLESEFGIPVAPGFDALTFRARGTEDFYELTLICEDGHRLPTMVSVTALRDEHEAVIGYLLIGSDNTARKRIEVEKERLAEVLRGAHCELSLAKIEAERANQAKSDFLSQMSHELRSPLNAILGFAQLIEAGQPPPTPGQKDSVDQIIHAGWYLLELINEILDLTVIESGKLVLACETLALADVLAECRAMCEPQARKHGIQLLFTAPPEPLYVQADRTRVKQIVINLLSNAIKYNRPEGSVAVHCSATKGRVRITVADTGPGLSAEQLGQLFQPFNRLGREQGSEEGTGIGLVVSQRLAELMQGEVGARSSPDLGSEFWVELVAATPPALVALVPLVALATPAGEAKPASPAGVNAWASPLPPRTLLWVEDSQANVLLIRQVLARRPQVQSLSAPNGCSGYALAQQAKPDVILLDLDLPGISGLAALQLLQTDPGTAHIPVIAISADALPHDIERGLAAGFFRYIAKPIQLDPFMHTLDLALERSPQRPS